MAANQPGLSLLGRIRKLPSETVQTLCTEPKTCEYYAAAVPGYIGQVTGELGALLRSIAP
ncbi:hypothetical protein [Planotetraspora sp. GP83]|uniref:hypothetical protein n=1 Tax=Planotetraspora sp. GP83 TaxID=3156264 RepID=UPI0035143DE5